ncbi:MAG: helix-turn-helix domain-containing protein, partial [Chloroflexi bacterium]|nr:helix-turn-helix domain-containing protein [Chloroflexota bacterium]
MRERLDDTEYSASASTGLGQETDEPTIVIEDEGLRLGFTQLPNYLFQVRGLSHSAKLTYALILSYAWQKDYCFPGQETLARDLEVSTRSVIEYLKELQARGLIRIQRRGLGKTNVYHVLRYPPAADHPAPHPTPTPGPSRARHGASHPDVKRASHQGLTSTSPLDARKTSHPE